MNPQEPTKEKRYIFIDTCVIQAAGNKNKKKSEAVLDCLKNLGNEGYSLAISEISYYENLHGLWGQQADKSVDLLKVYERKVVSLNVLLLASMLGGLFKDERIEHVDMGDKIIASTALLERGKILTENHRDYPSPFFIMESYFPIAYQDGHHLRTIDLGLYKPNYELINRRVEEREGR